MTRAEKVAKAQELRAQGLKLREVAERMGFALTTVHAWLSDPDRSREIARKRGCGGTCADCGNPTSSGDHERCSGCRHTFEHETRRWTREAIVVAIQTYDSENGRVPTAQKWLHPPYDPRYPSVSLVQREFGTWNAAIAAAGFEPLPWGHKRHDYPASLRDKALAMYASGLSAYEVGAALEVSHVTVWNWARRAGVSRSASEALRLRWQREKAA